MSKPLKITIGVSITLLVIIVSVIFFLRSLLTKSFPTTEGRLTVTGLLRPVHIYRDAMGVPHIRAASEHDMFLAVGYVHAQDRLWQMDVIRRAGQGRLSEIFGDATVEFDKLFRTVGLARVADEIEKRLRLESREALEAYAEGVNAFISDNGANLPVEFDMLDYRPEPWQPKHSIIIGRMIAWELNLASVTDVTFGFLAARVGIQKAREVFPSWPAEAPMIIPSRGVSKPSAASGLAVDDSVIEILREVSFPDWFSTVNRNYREQLGEGESGGSNCWVVGPIKSVGKKPLLANDIHLLMPAPARWYQIHFSSFSSGADRARSWDVAGVSIPGSPLVIVGRNQSIAWGVTNAMVDDADFFLEQNDSAFTKYNYRGKMLPLDVREEKIYVGTDDSISILVRRTHHGPIVSDLEQAAGNGDKKSAQYSFAMRWTGLDVSDEFYAFYLMNKARNAREFESGVRHLSVPGQNVVFADTLGNIGYWMAARVPFRGKRLPLLPLAGWTGENEWRGYIPFDRLPRLWNPSEGFIATANNKIVGDGFGYHMSDLWEPPSRISRIRELLTMSARLTAEDFKRFQTDVVSPFGKEFATFLLQAFQNDSIRDPQVASALEYLRNWDFRFSTENVASSIVNVTFVRFLHNVFEDELGELLLKHFVTFSAIPYRIASQVLAADTSSWFDDIRTPAVETKDEILRKSMYDALNELQNVFGSETKLWWWGSLHTVTFVHPFGRQKPLDKVFNIGPYSVGGSSSTIYKTEFRLNRPYAVSVGPSLRHVIDLGNPGSFSSVITSGASGQALHKHYDDQSVLWLNGGYHTITTGWNEITELKWEHLILQPTEDKP